MTEDTKPNKAEKMVLDASIYGFNSSVRKAIAHVLNVVEEADLDTSQVVTDLVKVLLVNTAKLVAPITPVDADKTIVELLRETLTAVRKDFKERHGSVVDELVRKTEARKKSPEPVIVVDSDRDENDKPVLN